MMDATPIRLEPGPKRDALLNSLAEVADRVAARSAMRDEARLREKVAAARAPAISSG